MWLPKDDLKDPSTWSSPHLDCKDTAPPQSQPEARARVGHSQHEAYLVRGEDVSNVASIPAQHRVTQQILTR